MSSAKLLVAFPLVTLLLLSGCGDDTDVPTASVPLLARKGPP